MRQPRLRRGFSLLEILIVMAIIATLAAVAMPKVGEAVAQARESAALQHLKAIHSAQAAYFARQGRFAAALAELGPPPPGAGLIPGELARGERIGYRFALAAREDGYALTAQPAGSASTVWLGASPRRRSFYTDDSLIIRASAAGEATAESPELGAPPADGRR